MATLVNTNAHLNFAHVQAAGRVSVCRDSNVNICVIATVCVVVDMAGLGMRNLLVVVQVSDLVGLALRKVEVDGQWPQ